MLLISVFFLIATVCFLLFLYVWSILHTSLRVLSDPDPSTPAKENLVFETKEFRTKDGINLSGWYIPAKKPKAVIVIVHGYYDTKATILHQAGYLYNAGYTTFFTDLRSAHRDVPSTLGIKEWQDVEAAYDYIKSRPEHKGLPVGFYSGSMGAASTIVAVGKTGKGDFLIAALPYANFTNLFRQQLRYKRLPTFLLSFVSLAAAFELGFDYAKYAPAEYIDKIHTPIFIISADNDTVVDALDTNSLFEKAHKPKEFWQAPSSHALFEDAPDQLQKHVLAFLDKYAT
jgi:hypothetical protein